MLELSKEFLALVEPGLDEALGTEVYGEGYWAPKPIFHSIIGALIVTFGLWVLSPTPAQAPPPVLMFCVWDSDGYFCTESR